MELINAIKERRSIRKYEEGCKITEAEIKEILEAAVMAPSWKNSETGRYHVIMSEEKLEAFKANALPEYNANNAKNAAALIVTTFVKDRAGFEKDGTPNNELGNGWGIYDLGLQNQNLMLKAWEMGYGTLVMGLRYIDKIKELLDIPENEVIVSVLCIGKPDIEPNAPVRKEVDEIVKFY